MKLASSWLRVLPDDQTVLAGVFVQGAGRLIAPVACASRPGTLWVKVIKRLISGGWFDYRDYELKVSQVRIEKLLNESNEKLGTNFALVSRYRYGHGAEIGLIGG